MKEYKGFLVDDDLVIYNSKTGHSLTPYIGSDGYMQVVRTVSYTHLTLPTKLEV